MTDLILGNPTSRSAGCPLTRLRNIWRSYRDWPEIYFKPFQYFVRTVVQHPDYKAYDWGYYRFYMLNDPEGIRHVLLNSYDYHKSVFYQVVRKILGRGLLIVEDQEWLAQRRASLGQFAAPSLERMAGIIVSTIQNVMNEWERRADNGQTEVNFSHEMTHLAMSAVFAAAFNLQPDEKLRSEIAAAFNPMLIEADRRAWSIIKLPLMLAERLSPKYTFSIRQLRKIAGRIIDERKAMPEQPDDLLGSLLKDQSQRGTDSDQVVEQLLLMIIAGYETVAAGMSWMGIMLSRHPDVQRRLQIETDTAIGTRPPVYADLPKLGYARMVFQETLRLYPPLWTMSRTAQKDDVIPLSNGKVINVRKGEHIMLSPYATHRNPRLWPNPEGFDPERFADERCALHMKYAYFPFGGGPRNCLGDRLATMEATFVLAMLAQRFTLELVPGQDIHEAAMSILRPSGNVRIRLVRRHRQDNQQSPMPNSATDISSTTPRCPFHTQAA